VSAQSALPRTARDVFKLGPIERLLYHAIIAFYEWTGLWHYPANASGDLETMTFMDKVYWLYKTTNPIDRASRRSGLEEHFEAQKSFGWQPPSHIQVKGEMTLSAVGDLMNHRYLLNSSNVLYKDVSDVIFGADVSMANLECVIYPKGTGALSFSPRNGPPLYYNLEEFSIAKGFAGRKYSFMATACNHSLDFGEDGVRSTIGTLKAEGIAFNGVSVSEKDARSATIVERSGFKIGLISHTFGLNAYRPPEDKPWIVNRSHLNGQLGKIDLRQLEEQIRFCKESKADFVVVQFHWGMEHELYPRPDQVKLSHHLAESGVDLILGHHPHVVQPFEFYRTKRDPDRVVPIYYSLGNLVNPFSAPYLCLSYVARVALVKDVLADGSERTYVRDAGAVEIVQVVDDKNGKIRLCRKADRREAQRCSRVGDLPKIPAPSRVH
jgi:capsule synthesis protein PGA_cap